jgi:hypothetical protein
VSDDAIVESFSEWVRTMRTVGDIKDFSGSTIIEGESIELRARWTEGQKVYDVRLMAGKDKLKMIKDQLGWSK